MISRLKSEGGYTLVEVMVAIMILLIAIIPMVSMFDTGLNAATRASNYDKARALAKKQLETSQSLPYASVRTSFPNAPCTFDTNGLCAVGNLEVPDAEDPPTAEAPDGEFGHLRYAIEKQFVKPNPADDSEFVNAADDTGMMKITVEVGWGGADFDDVTYTATDIKVR